MSSAGDQSISVATLSQALGFSETIVEVGHTHPGVRRVLDCVGGTASFLVSLDEERIIDLEVDIGIGHRGVEKEVESLPWHRALPYMSRLGFAGGLMAEVGYCLAVEALAGVALPDRAIWLRTLACEVARTSDHFSRLAAIATAIGLPAAEAVAQQGEIHSAALLRDVTDSGPLQGWVRLGGVATTLPDRFSEIWTIARTNIESVLARFNAVAVDNPSCQHRLRDVATLSADDCIAWGVTGPVVRAAGLAMDVRSDAPYLAYAAVDFDIPIGENGDDYDRLLVVVEEIRQSLRIVDQCHSLLVSLGPGALQSVEPGWGEWDRANAAAHSAAILDGPSIPAGEVARSIEASTGEMLFLLVSDGTELPRRVHCRGASFLHAQAMPAMLRGAQLDDLLATAATLHLISGECDR